MKTYYILFTKTTHKLKFSNAKERRLSFQAHPYVVYFTVASLELCFLFDYIFGFLLTHYKGF